VINGMASARTSRTSALKTRCARKQAYLDQARLSHTGSFGWNARQRRHRLVAEAYQY
jgi:hypothetical protein